MIWVLLVLVLCIGCLLWLPIRVEVDTRQSLYRLSWQGLFACWVVPEEVRWRWFIRVFFWQKEWFPAKKTRSKALKSKPEKASSPKRKSSFSFPRVRMILRNFLGAVRFDVFRVNWDTGDFILNAWLYPVFQIVSRERRQLSINFTGEQELTICLHTRLGLLALAAMRIFLSFNKY